MRHFLLFLLLLASSCSKQRAALYHFNQVNDIIKKIDKLQIDYYQKLNDAIINGKTDEAEVIRRELVSKLQSYIEKIRKVHSVNDTSLHNAAVTCYENITGVMQNELKQYVTLSSFGSQSEQIKDNINTLLGAIQSKSANYINEYKKAREEFAKKYELEIIQ